MAPGQAPTLHVHTESKHADGNNASLKYNVFAFGHLAENPPPGMEVSMRRGEPQCWNARATDIKR